MQVQNVSSDHLKSCTYFAFCWFDVFLQLLVECLGGVVGAVGDGAFWEVVAEDSVA